MRLIRIKSCDPSIVEVERKFFFPFEQRPHKDDDPTVPSDNKDLVEQCCFICLGSYRRFSRGLLDAPDSRCPSDPMHVFYTLAIG